MRNLMILGLLLAVAGGIHSCGGPGRPPPVGSIDLAAHANHLGFVPVGMNGGARPGQVLVVAPVNCPSQEGQRATALVAALRAQGIPVRHTQNIHFELPPTTHSIGERVPAWEWPEELLLFNEVFAAAPPIVLIDGMAKASPSLEDVIEQYRQAR